MYGIVKTVAFSFGAIVAFVAAGMFVMVGFMRFIEILVPLFDRFWRMVL